MNPRDWKALNRVVAQLERQSRSRSRRSPRRFTVAPLALGLGLFLGEYLLVGLAPRVLPPLPMAEGPNAVGVERLPGLVWRLSAFCQWNHSAIPGSILAVTVVMVLLSYRFGFVRKVAWLSALAIVALNILILFVIYNASLDAAVAPL